MPRSEKMALWKERLVAGLVLLAFILSLVLLVLSGTLMQLASA